MCSATPMPNESANTLSQKSNTRRQTGLPVASRVPWVASQSASPMVKAGTMMETDDEGELDAREQYGVEIHVYRCK